jgi:hypothetical protein
LSTQTQVAPRGRPAGITFAAVVMIAVGCMRVLSAIYYFADSDRVTHASSGPFSHHLVYWGVWDLLIAAIALGGGFGLLQGKEYGYALGYGFAGIVILQSLLLLAATPWFAAAGLLLGVLVLRELASGDAQEHGYSDPKAHGY